MTKIDRLCQVLQEASVRYATEAQMHLDLRAALKTAGIAHETELRLSDRNRVDLAVADAGGWIVIEVKVRGKRTDVERQIARYAIDPAVVAVILVTSVIRHARLDSSYCMKPLHVIVHGDRGLR